MRAPVSSSVFLLLGVVPVACHRDTETHTGESVQVAPGVAYSLEDGERYHREVPETFEIPSREARDALVPGQIAKLMFRITAADESQVERMWVIVEGREAGGYVGALDNQPVTTDAMRPGMRVHFQPRHVIDIYPERAGDEPAA